jgi:hypothetical protein
MNPKQETVPVERGSNPEGYFEMVNRVLGIAEKTMGFADSKLFAFPWEELDRAECGFFCGIELFVRTQKPSKSDQTACLLRRVTGPFVNLQ